MIRPEAIALTIACLSLHAQTLKLSQKNPNGVYSSGAPVPFVIEATEKNGQPATGEVHFQFFKDIATKSVSGKIRLMNGRAAITNPHIKQPGCVMFVATYKGVEKRLGAVVDPFNIKPAQAEPKDFDRFWARQKAKLAAVKIAPKLTPVEDPKANYGRKVECFDIQMDCIGGKPVSGYFAKPTGAKPKSLPAILSLHSAGIRDSSLRAAWVLAKRNALGMDIKAHGLPNGKGSNYYHDLSRNEMRNYGKKGIGDPEAFYLLGMYMRMVRAIDFLTAQPEWDGKTLIMQGTSQGGGQAIVIAGLDQRVTEIQAVVPAFCDLDPRGTTRKAAHPGAYAQTDQQFATMRYFEATHFAARIRAKAKIKVGLIDTTCAATGILAAYNQIAGEKEIVILPGRDHSGRSGRKDLKNPIFKHKHSARE